MDENLIITTTEEIIEVTSEEIQQTEVTIEDEEYDVTTEEVITTVEVDAAEAIEIEMEESMGWVGGDNTRHYSLIGRDDPNQHEIKAITGLRDELDEIKRLKTLYSDKFNAANYYKWHDAKYDEYGYFVSIVPGTTEIEVCEGQNIFGVTVSSAGFIGGQDATVPRDNSYGLVATSGIVGVRCELGVEVGNYVVSNKDGYAKKSTSNYGYYVISIENKNGVEYAVISLDIQADKTNEIGKKLIAIDDVLDAHDASIISAINAAHQAHKQSLETFDFASDIEEKRQAVGKKADQNEVDIKEANDTIEELNRIVVQTRAIANNAATSADSIKNEAVDVANNAWSGINALTKELEPITTWKDDETGATGAEYLASYMNQGLATTAEVREADLKTEKAMSAIQKSAKEIQSLVTTIDKYTVGPYSQAHGLTFKQASDILENGMIYVPIDEHEESYEDIDEDGEDNTYTRKFTPQYLYQWGKVNNQWRWITVDKNFDETDEVNTSSKAVYFTTKEPVVGDNFGYWYTDGDVIEDVNGVTDTYEPYTLYKWEEDHWLAVATLVGNVNNRAISQISQTANKVAFEVLDARGSFAGMQVSLDGTKSEVQSLSAWKNGDNVSDAIIRQETKDGQASIVISTLLTENGETSESASLVLSAKQKEDGTGSLLAIDADHINFEGFVSFANKQELEEVQNNAIYDTKVEYALSSSSTEFVAVDGDDGQWSEIAPIWSSDAYMWQKTTITKGDGTDVSTQTCIQGSKGEDGNDGQTPYVKDGNWWIGETDLGVKAEGEDGSAPTITIVDGYWYIDGENTNVKAEGTEGTPAPTVVRVEKQYYLSSSNDKLIDGEWSTSPAMFQKNHYMWVRDVYMMSDETEVDGEPVVDNTFTTISSWCQETNTTLIDGANIATGTIAAESIKSGKVDAKLVLAGEVIADKAHIGGESTIAGFTVTDDAIYSNNKTAYSSSTEGVYIGSDGIGLGNDAFYVTNSGDLYATKGNIGGWAIDKIHQDRSDIGIIKRGSTYTTGMAAIGDGSSVAFWAGCTGGTPWEVADYDEHTGFFVTEDGKLHATRGEIGGWEIGDKSIWSNNSGICSVYDGVLDDEMTDITDIPATQNIEYELIDNDQCYKVISVPVDIQDVVIPATYNGKPVTMIGDYACAACSMLSITIPSSIQTIAPDAFSDCGNLQRVYITDLVAWCNIDFQNTTSNPLINGASLYVNGIIQKSLKIPDSITTLKPRLFAGGTFKKVYLHNNLQTIGIGTFSRCRHLISIFAYDSLQNIADGAFNLCSRLIAIYYTGNNTQWQAISKGVSNNSINLATIYYNSTSSYLFPSLNRGKSYPRFYAGCKSINDNGVPMLYDDPDFMVLEDGSLYAGDVMFNGTTTCFDMTVYASDNSILRFGTNGGIMMSPRENESGGNYWAKYTKDGIWFGITRFDYGGAIDFGASIQNYGDMAKLFGTWNAADGSVITSDANLKHCIELLDDRYDLFFDNIVSRRFKYNHGTSDRYHCGYIAQEIQSALHIASIDEKECAAICTFKHGTEDEFSGLRYAEFVSLNTWQIQKLKKRVSELEDKISILTKTMNIE